MDNLERMRLNALFDFERRCLLDRIAELVEENTKLKNLADRRLRELKDIKLDYIKRRFDDGKTESHS